MSELSLQDLERTATAYDQLLVPGVLQAWMPVVVSAAEIGRGQRVLDVACGTGTLTRAAKLQTDPGGLAVGLDINPGMLSVAARGGPDIEWRQGEAESLPFEQGVFNAVVSQFGLMFFANREKAIQEMVRVLQPKGRLAVAVFDSLPRIPAYETMTVVFERVVGRSVADALRFPFVLGDKKGLASLFLDAGIPSATITSHTAMGRFATASDMVFADVRGWFPFARIKLNECEVEAVIHEAERALQPFMTAGGAVEFQVSAHIVKWTKP